MLMIGEPCAGLIQLIGPCHQLGGLQPAGYVLRVRRGRPAARMPPVEVPAIRSK